MRLAAEPTAPGELRRVVTVLFADLSGSTALGEQLDPEALRAILTRYFTALRAVIEHHGGTVEKFIGDAVMAVFGIPIAHEDDAVRAVRAAADIASTLEQLNVGLEAERGVSLSFRTGINTGEVVAAAGPSATTLVTGDTVNTAARLEQAAAPGETLLGSLTYSLVRDAVVAEPMPPLAAKGKAEPIEAFRLVSVSAGAAGRARRMGTALVGRDRELSHLEHVFRTVVDTSSAALFTLLGTAGVGKSRLTAEFLERAREDAIVLRGRCLSYGEGITYWPVGELIRTAAGITDADPADVARAKVEALFTDLPGADELSATISAAIGLTGDRFQQDGLFWAIRRLFEHLARERPVVAVVEDIHWAEPTMLDLIEHVVEWSRDVPLLVLCPARPQLLEVRPSWGGGKLNATTVLLEPLRPAATAELIRSQPGGDALPEDLVRRVAEAADGNPLFLEELVAMFIDDGILRAAPDGSWQPIDAIADVRIPVSIQALLAARLDQLAPPERGVAERASVVGRVFDRSAVTELSPEAERETVADALRGLVRKDVIRPERGDHGSGETFSFRHVLIRDAAYDGLSKNERSRLHEHFADWLEGTTGERLVEIEEIVGYHFEQAHENRRELGESGPPVDTLADRAARLLYRTGERAFHRQDHPAATVLLQRAHDLAVDPALRVRAGMRLARCLFKMQRPRDATEVGERVADEAAAIGDEVAAADARLSAVGARDTLGSIADRQLKAEVDRAGEVFERADDAEGLARIEMIRSYLHSREGRERESIEAARRAAVHSARSGDVAGVAGALANVADSYVFGSWPVADAIERVVEDLGTTSEVPDSHHMMLGALAILQAMAGNVGEARRSLEERAVLVAERGRTRDNANRFADGIVALLGEDPAWAVDELDHAYREAVDVGDFRIARMHGLTLAEIVLRLGDRDRAREIAGRLALDAEAPPDEVSAVEAVNALLASGDGNHAAAIEHARTAVEQIDGTDWLELRANAWLRLAGVLRAAGDTAAAARAGERAAELASRKGSVVTERRARALLAGLEERRS